MVEMAFALPLLILLLFGLIEFGWLFAQNVEIRHTAREGARLLAVNTDPPTAGANQTARLLNAICSRGTVTRGVSVSITRNGDEIGDVITTRVNAPAGMNTLTGVLDWAIPSTLRLQSAVQIRIEQVPTWTASSRSC